VDNIYWLGQVQTSDQELVGEKAYYLNSLMQRGYPVVPGFVVCAQRFWEFLGSINWLEPLFADLPNSSLYFNPDNARQLQTIAVQIREHILTAPLSDSLLCEVERSVSQFNCATVILRSSLTSHSIKTSGLLESHLVWTDPQALALGIKRAWAEIFRARNLFYWRRRGIKLQQIKPVVLVQPIYSAIASGTVIASQKHPWEIHATWGLGMSILTGESIPDFYQVQPKTRSISMQRLGQKTLAYDVKLRETESRSSRSFVKGASVIPTMNDPDSCRQTYLLSEAEQNEYALDRASLDKLMALTEKLNSDLGTSFQLEWVLSQKTVDEEPQVYITQISALKFPEVKLLKSENILSSNSISLRPSHSRFLKGLAAASGKAHAIAQVVSYNDSPLMEFPPGSILVASEIHSDWLPWLKIAAGVISEKGGMTGHGAILARELGIPAVVGALGATRMIKTGESVLIDGDKGEVYLEEIMRSSENNKGLAEIRDNVASEFIMSEKDQDNQKVENSENSVSNFSDFVPSIPRKNLSHWPNPMSSFSGTATEGIPLHSFSYPLATGLFVNMSQSSSLDRVLGLPIDGIGLLRSELMALEVLDGQHPQAWLKKGKTSEFIDKMTHQLARFAKALAPRPVVYRSLDLREFNGNGALSYSLEPDLFNLELAIVSQVQGLGYHNIHFMLPFVRTVEDFIFARQLVEKMGLNQYPDFQMWIMAEVPSVLLLLPEYVKAGVQGISIGTNDLTQLLLGVDRNSINLLNSRPNLAVWRFIQQLIELARQEKIPCSICGDAPALYPDMIESLVRWGINSISVNVDAVEKAYSSIMRAEQRLILEAARSQINNSPIAPKGF
jgi:pyruvate,water dikinase